MTLNEKLIPEEFVATRMSHNGYKEYFDSIGVNPNDYKPTHLSIPHFEKTPSSEFSYHAELTLAQNAIEKGCKYVTNLDYCQFNPDKGCMILAGTGWLQK